MTKNTTKIRIINEVLMGPSIDNTYNIEFVPRIGETIVFEDGWLFEVSNIKHYPDERKIHVYVHPR